MCIMICCFDVVYKNKIYFTGNFFIVLSQHIFYNSNIQALSSCYKESFYESFIKFKIVAKHIHYVGKRTASTSKISIKQTKQSACV